MTRTRHRLAVVGIALLVVASVVPLPPSGGIATAAEHTFVVEQGSRCFEVSPLRGSEDVASFYDYRNVENEDGATRYTYSSYMPRQLTAEDVSRLFLYEGPNGVSLVAVHNAVGGDEGDGSAATFRFRGLPAGGDWVVVDDDYPGQDDRFSRTRIDWMWYGDRTDGGVFRGLDRDGTEITVVAAFDERAALYDRYDRTGDVRAWQFLTGSVGDPGAVGLDPTEPITIRTGHCGPDETPPSAALSTSDGVAGYPVTFDASGSSDDRGVAEYRWDFDGDGSVDRTTPDSTVSHRYASPGTYDATVTVVDAAGNADRAQVRVAVEADDPPTAAFRTSDSPTQGFPVTFDARNATDDVGVTGYRWDFDGDGTVDRRTEDPTVARTYEAAGSYEVSLTVVDGSGKNDTTISTVSVDADDPPDPAIRVASPETPVEGQRVVLNAGNSTDDTGIRTFRWSFGDGATATGRRVAHTFDGNGTFTVTLEVTDEGGNTANATARIEVLPPDETPPDAAASANRTTVEAGAPVAFDASDSGDDRSVAGYRWNFGDDAAANGARAVHAFGSAGTYEATVTVTDGGGNVATANVTVEVTPARAPNVSASVPETVLAGRNFTVEGTATDGGSGVARYRWEFDDGTTETGARAAHLYQNPGTHTVTLVAVDRGGHANATTHRIEVLPPDETPPSAALTVETNRTEVGTAIDFDANGSTDAETSIVEYRWDFDGDGEVDATTAGPTVEHAYRSSGTFDATVTVVDRGGNTDEATVAVRVEPDREAHRDDGGGGGSRGGVSSGGSGADLGPPPVVTEVEKHGANAGLVDVRNGRGDETVRADLPESATGEESGVRFRSLAVDLARDDPHFVVETRRTATSLPADVTLGSLSVEVKYVRTRQVDGVTYEVAVERSRLTDVGLVPEDLSAYWKADGAWKEANATIVERGPTVVLRARTDAFASVGVGGERPVSVVDVELGETRVAADEPVSVTASVRNEGDESETFAANLTVDGEVVATETVEVPVGETATVTVEKRLAPGTHSVGLDGRAVGPDGRAVGNVTVAEPTADVVVAAVSVNESAITAGERVAITATVENRGTAAGERSVALTLFGERVATEQVEVPANATERVTFVRSVDAPGTYTAEVGNASATLEVTARETTAGGTETPSSDVPIPVPGFGVVAAVVALVAGLLVARLRR